jgi:hypothetical protein
MVLIDAAYGFADAINEIREIRGRSLPADNLPVHTPAGYLDQGDPR